MPSALKAGGGGKFLISTHGVWLYHPHPGDYRRWTHTGLVKEIEQYRFSVTQIVGLVGPLAWTSQIRLLGYRQLVSGIPIVGPVLFTPIVLFMNLRMAIEEAVTPNHIRHDHASIYLCLCEGT